MFWPCPFYDVPEFSKHMLRTLLRSKTGTVGERSSRSREKQDCARDETLNEYFSVFMVPRDDDQEREFNSIFSNRDSLLCSGFTATQSGLCIGGVKLLQAIVLRSIKHMCGGSHELCRRWRRVREMKWKILAS